MISKYRQTIGGFSTKYWVIVVAAFIDRLGGTMLFPFFALYITSKFNVGMTQAGILLGMFSISRFVGNLVGGALTDKFGRRTMVIFGLTASAGTSVTMGLVNEYQTLFMLVVFVGWFANIAAPAYQAMIVDLVPEEKRAEGFGILRVAANLSWVAGPMIGSIIIGYSYLYVFIADAVTSVIVAGIVYRLIPETMPDAAAQKAGEQSVWQTILGYFQVSRDKLFIAFIAVNVVQVLVYHQIYTTLSVYLRDVHGLAEQKYAFLMSANAFTVVLFQFLVTRVVSKYAPMVMLALGSALYMVGITAFGLVSIYPLFLAAMLVVTVGEMVIMPVSQALASRFAPEEMRGRYMAVYGVSWMIPTTVGPVAAGLILDHPTLDPNLVWYIGGALLGVSILGYLGLNGRTQERFGEEIEAERVARLATAD